MSSFIHDFPFTIHAGTTYIFRGYVYHDVLSKIDVLHQDYTPVSGEEQKSYTLTAEESKNIYTGITTKL